MSLNLEEKKAVVAEVSAQIADMAVASLLRGDNNPDRTRLFLDALADAQAALGRLEDFARN